MMRIGKHSKIEFVDCMKGMDSLKDESVAITFTSPPYWNYIQYPEGGKMAKKAYTADDLMKKNIISRETPYSEVERLLEYANDPNTYFAYDEEIVLLHEEAKEFVSFVLYDGEKPDEIPEMVWQAIERIAVQLRLKCDKPMKPLFREWGPW